MKTTIKELLNGMGIAENESVYALCNQKIREFPVTAGNFFHAESFDKWQNNLWIHEIFCRKMEEKKSRPIYKSLEEQLVYVTGQIGKIKETDPKGYDHMEELRALRSVKKGITKAMENLTEYYQTQADSEIESEYGVKRRQVLVYKNTVSMGSFTDLERQIPALNNIKLSWIRECPLLLGNIPELKKATERGEQIGIVGGPCLFGTYEVEVLVHHKDGQIFTYDFSSGHRYDKIDKETMDFANHMEYYRSKVDQVDFLNLKKGMTAQEAESLEVLFVFAQVLKAKLAIPIPDISYQKYLYTVLEKEDEDLRLKTIEKFRVITRKIADFYLAGIEELKKEYPDVEVLVLHERDEALCKEFHEKREVYFRKSGLIQRMTAKRQKTDAIFDYISMLALPFYFWGTPHVIQIDNLDETDSYRKCKKVHKRAFSLSSVLYPERLSCNGEDTIFNAPLAYKEYLKEEDEEDN